MWLLAAIVEDERQALAASPGPWHPNAEHDEVLAVDDIEVCDGFALSNRQLRATVDHIAAWDPERVLAECEAKRKIVTRYKFARNQADTTFHSQAKRAAWEKMAGALEADVLDLASVYAQLGRPGYREKWRPGATRRFQV
jgi:hypothetical protein